MKNKALIYSRVSTDEQAQNDRQSLKTQVEICKKAIHESNLYELAENGTYEDPGRSATNMDRPGLQDMLLRVEDDKTIGAVFVQDTDRLARNVGDHLIIKTLLKKHEVKLISVSQSGLEDTPEGNFMDLVIAGVNQFQSQITARKTIKSMEQKFKDGGWPTHATIGYLNVGKKEHNEERTIIVDPINGPLVTEAFKMYATGDYSVVAVADHLNKKGMRSKNGKTIFANKLAEVLKNHFYYGEMRWRGLVNKGNHEPLTTKNIFDRCQLVAREHDHHKCRKNKFNFVLRGFVRCAVCNSRYVGDHNNVKDKSYYHCNKYKFKRHGTPAPCSGKYIEVSVLEKVIEKEFNKLQFSTDFIETIEAKITTAYEAKKATVSKEKTKLAQVKAAVEKKLEVAEDKLIKGVIDDASYTRLRNQYREEITNLETEISRAERAKNIKMDATQETLGLIRNIGDTYKNAKPNIQQLYLSLFWDHFEAEDGKLTKAVKSPIVLALEAIGYMTPTQLKRPVLSKFASACDSVRLENVGGAYRESNSN